MASDIKFSIGQLRHLYWNLLHGYVNEKTCYDVANYLLSPVIRDLEEHQKELDLQAGVKPENPVVE